MKGFLRHPFTEWIVTILAIMAGFIVIKFVISYLPSGGIPGAFKNVVMSA